MKPTAGPELQRAIQFLSSLAKGDRGPLPDRPDYEGLARLASEFGHELSPGAVKEAFRLLMRARLVALRTKPGNHGGGSSPDRRPGESRGLGETHRDSSS
jgi:hypothetical protein